jgi:ADP-ribose pyrophosphatase YjhB (NUDIX family)
MDIYFRHDQKCFNFRVAGVIRKDDKVLLSNFGDFYTLPGGRVKFGEHTELAIKREILEELHMNVKVTKLLSINENFFDYGEDEYHEVLFVYLCEIDDDIDLNSINKIKTDKEQFKFVNYKDLFNYNLKPEFLLTELKKLPKSISHNVNK